MSAAALARSIGHASILRRRLLRLAFIDGRNGVWWSLRIRRILWFTLISFVSHVLLLSGPSSVLLLPRPRRIFLNRRFPALGATGRATSVRPSYFKSQCSDNAVAGDQIPRSINQHPKTPRRSR